jgi:hypothetical protein
MVMLLIFAFVRHLNFETYLNLFNGTEPVELPPVNLQHLDQIYRLVKNIPNNQKLSLAAALNEVSGLNTSLCSSANEIKRLGLFCVANLSGSIV